VEVWSSLEGKRILARTKYAGQYLFVIRSQELFGHRGWLCFFWIVVADKQFTLGP
jgi:hypothetical protein